MTAAEIITEIESLLERATPGPWEASIVAGYILIGGEPMAHFTTDARAADGRATCTLRNAAPLLLAALRFGVAYREWETCDPWRPVSKQLDRARAKTEARDSLYAEMEKA